MFFASKIDFVEMISRFVSAEQSRYYLCGLYIEKQKKGGALIVATDGHRLGVIYDKDAIVDGFESMIIPLSFIMKMKLQKYAKGHGDKAFVWHDNLASIVKIPPSMTHLDIMQKVSPFHEHMEYAKPVDGIFPEWKRFVPKKADLKPAEFITFNAGYLASFRNKGHSAQIWSSGPMAPAIIRIEAIEEFLGVIMPMNAGKTKGGAYPDWFTE